MKRFNYLIIFFNLFIFLAGTAASLESDSAVAKIGGCEITKADLERIIGYYDEDKRKAAEANPQIKAALLRRIVQAMAISEIAREKDFDQEPGVKEQMELSSNDFLASLYVKKQVIDKVHVTEDDMKLYYKINREAFSSPEMVRARDIYVKVDMTDSDETREEAKKKAEEILKKVKAGENFAKLASEYSDDKVAGQRGGDLGFFGKGMTRPEFEQAAFSLKPGEVSGVVDTGDGFHIIKMEEKKGPVIEPYEQVKDRVRELVFKEMKKTKVEEFFDKAMRDAGAEFHYELLHSGEGTVQ